MATNVGGVDGAFSSFPTNGFVSASTVSGRTTDGVGWIANNAAGSNGGTWTFFVFRQSFDLTGYDPSTAQLSFQWAADDSGEGFANRGTWVPKYRLNGAALVPGQWAGGATYDFGLTTTVASGFVSGINTIDFFVEGNGTTDGFALRSLGLTAAVPEPATWLTLLAGLLMITSARSAGRRGRGNLLRATPGT